MTKKKLPAVSGFNCFGQQHWKYSTISWGIVKYINNKNDIKYKMKECSTLTGAGPQPGECSSKIG